jgi:hypothetical protein
LVEPGAGSGGFGRGKKARFGAAQRTQRKRSGQIDRRDRSKGEANLEEGWWPAGKEGVENVRFHEKGEDA